MLIPMPKGPLGFCSNSRDFRSSTAHDHGVCVRNLFLSEECVVFPGVSAIGTMTGGAGERENAPCPFRYPTRRTVMRRDDPEFEKKCCRTHRPFGSLNSDESCHPKSAASCGAF